MKLFPVHEVNKHRLWRIKKWVENNQKIIIKVVLFEGVLYAVEGTHRLAAAYEMGLPVVLDVYDAQGDRSVPGVLDLDYGLREWTMSELIEYLIPATTDPYFVDFNSTSAILTKEGGAL